MIEGTLADVTVAAKIVGTLPQIDNIAALVLPPCSTMDEAQWITQIIQPSGAADARFAQSLRQSSGLWPIATRKLPRAFLARLYSDAALRECFLQNERFDGRFSANRNRAS